MNVKTNAKCHLTQENGFITDRIYADLITRAKATTTQYFKRLLSFGLIDRKGKGKATYYVVKEE